MRLRLNSLTKLNLLGVSYLNYRVGAQNLYDHAMLNNLVLKSVICMYLFVWFFMKMSIIL